MDQRDPGVVRIKKRFSAEGTRLKKNPPPAHEDEMMVGGELTSRSRDPDVVLHDDSRDCNTKISLHTIPQAQMAPIQIQKRQKEEGEGGEIWERKKHTVNISLNALMRQNTAPIHVDLVPDRHIIAQDTHVLQPRPFPNGAVPPHNRALHPRMILHLATSQQHAPLQPHAVTHHHIGANGHIRAYPAIFPNLGRRVDEHVAAVDERFGGGGEQFGVLLREGGEVEACAAEEIFRLSDVHPEAFEVHGVELAVFTDGGESFLFDRGRA